MWFLLHSFFSFHWSFCFFIILSLQFIESFVMKMRKKTSVFLKKERQKYPRSLCLQAVNFSFTVNQFNTRWRYRMKKKKFHTSEEKKTTTTTKKTTFIYLSLISICKAMTPFFLLFFFYLEVIGQLTKNRKKKKNFQWKIEIQFIIELNSISTINTVIYHLKWVFVFHRMPRHTHTR